MSKYLVTVGKIRKYDGITGEIVSKEGIYMFTHDSVNKEHELKEDDVVMFRGEEIHGTKKAYFITKLKKEQNIEEQLTKKLRRPKENE